MRPNVVVVPVEGTAVVIPESAVEGDLAQILQQLNGMGLKQASVLFAEECGDWLKSHAPMISEVRVAPSVKLPRAERANLYVQEGFVAPEDAEGGWGWHSYRWSSGNGPLVSPDIEEIPGAPTWVLEVLVSHALITNGGVQMQVSGKLIELSSGYKLAHVEPTMRTHSRVVLKDHTIEGTEESIRATARDLCAEVLATLGLMRQG